MYFVCLKKMHGVKENLIQNRKVTIESEKKFN